MIISKKFIPSLFTILNAFCGFMSVISSSHSEFEQAILFIFYAAIFDMLDGMVARILKTSSDFGVELDSLSDVVSFGFAPSFLLYSFFFKDYNALGIIIASMILAFSAIRLARFNVSLVGYSKEVFYGIPTPMSALIICSYILFFHNQIFSAELSKNFIFVLTIITSLLMVSKFKMPTIPALNKSSIIKNKTTFILLLLAIIIAIFTKGLAIFPLCILYVIFGIVMTFFPQKRLKVKSKKLRK